MVWTMAPGGIEVVYLAIRGMMTATAIKRKI
jgi:hypothetical protein